MKIAVTYDIFKKTIFQHFGETKNFLIYDSANDSNEIVDNGGNSHRDLVPYLKSLGVDVLIAGGMGHHAIILLNEANIEVYPGIAGDAIDAINLYKEGKLVANMNAIHKCSH